MYNIFKLFVHKLFGIAGLKISKMGSTDIGELVGSFKYFEVNVVLDVGANSGQFSKELRKAGYKGRIVCFEPLPSAHLKLSNNFKSDDKTIIYKRAAVGAKKGGY